MLSSLLGLLVILSFGSETGDYASGLVTAECRQLEAELNGLPRYTFNNFGDFDLLIIINQQVAHKASCLLVDIYPDILDLPVFAESLLDVFVTEVAVDVLKVEAGVVLELEQGLYGVALHGLVRLALFHLPQLIDSLKLLPRLALAAVHAAADLLVAEIYGVAARGSAELDHIPAFQASGFQTFHCGRLAAALENCSVAGVQIYQHHLHV